MPFNEYPDNFRALDLTNDLKQQYKYYVNQNSKNSWYYNCSHLKVINV